MADIIEITRYFKALADPTRLRIVRLMAANGQALCVCELVDSLEEPQYHISRHLKELRDSGLLRGDREGRWVYYSLNDKDPIVSAITATVIALPEEAFAADQSNFHDRMALRQGGRCRIGIQKTYLAESETASATGCEVAVATAGVTAVADDKVLAAA